MVDTEDESNFVNPEVPSPQAAARCVPSWPGRPLRHLSWPSAVALGATSSPVLSFSAHPGLGNPRNLPMGYSMSVSARGALAEDIEVSNTSHSTENFE